MNKTLKKALLVLISCLLMASLVSACDFTIGGGNTAGIAVNFGGDKISVEEAKLYIYANQYETEAQNEYYVAYLFGSYEAFWAYGEDVTYGDQCALDAMNMLLQNKVLVKEAKKQGVTLTADEEKKVDEAVAAFKADKNLVIAKSGASDELVKTFVYENAIANKMYMKLTETVDTSMDSEEMTRKRIEGLSIVAKSSYTDDSDESVDYTDEEKKQNVNEAYLDVQEQYSNGTSADDIVDAYAESTTVTVQNIGEFAVSPENKEEGAFTNYRSLGWSLSTDEYGAAIVADTTAYILHCVSDDDSEYRAQAEEAELYERKTALFKEEFEKVSAKYKKYHVFTDNLSDVKVSEPVYDSEFLKSIQEDMNAETEEAEEE